MTALEQLDRTILLCRDYVATDLTDHEICHSLQSTRVLCVADLRNLSSLSGQTCLTTLVFLLSRMGMQVELLIPDVPMISSQTPISGKSLSAALAGSSEALITGATVRCDPNSNPDLTFAIGDTKIDNGNGFCWRLHGTDWDGALTIRTVEVNAWATEKPVGPMVSAALGANEAFKFALRRLPLRDQADQVFFEQSRSCTWTFGSICLPDEGLDLGFVDIISAGAISQAALFALTRFPTIRMHGRLFDDDVTAPSNLNRNMLTLACDVGLPKVQVVTQRCGTNLRLQPIAERFDERLFSEPLAPRMLVGVDDIPSRWHAQRQAPGWLAVSGTSHFNVSSSAHRKDQPCSGCLHPFDDPGGLNPIPTVSFVSFWAGLAMAVRLIREGLAIPYSKDRQHLWLTPLSVLAGSHSAL
ncbi:MAG: hypothetical protein DMG60_22690 [Acidobacteria bacterium]|nr:MAG: hypothetical protein DMG60_22690 [Acidobacteriota bacterium]